MKILFAIRGVLLVGLVVAGLSLTSSWAVPAQHPSKRASGHETRAAEAAESTMPHHVVTPAQIKWGPAPPSLPPGSQAAVLSGDPSKAGEPYTLTAKMPDGYTIPPHWHPVDESIVVISGQFLLGMGDTLDQKTTAIGAGGFAMMPKEVHHFAKAKGPTTIVVYGNGPFDVMYVNPKDDPRNKKTRGE